MFHEGCNRDEGLDVPTLAEEIAELKASESVDKELEAMKAALKAKGK